MASTLSLMVQPADHRRGPEHAPVTIVEYGDFECPSCKVAAPGVMLALERFPGKVQFVWRHFPLEQAHPHALAAAEASECAGAQGKFWQMHDFLMEHQAHLQGKDLHRYAEQIGLEMTRYQAEIGDHIYLQKIREHIASGERSHIRATPTFFVNGVVQDVSFGMRALHDAVAAAIQGPHR